MFSYQNNFAVNFFNIVFYIQCEKMSRKGFFVYDYEMNYFCHMLNEKEYNRFISLSSVYILAIVLFGLMFFSNSFENKSGISNNPVSTHISLSVNTAVPGQFIRLHVFQKTWIVNKDNFNLLGFNRNTLSDNKVNCIKISYLKQLRLGSNKIPHFLLRYHLFPAETDEPPLLS